MPASCRVVDADAHFIEPLGLWPEYLEPAFRSMAPRYVVTTGGQKSTVIGDYLFRSNLSSYKVEDTPGARLQAMDEEGIHSAVIYPTMGLHFGALERIDAAAAFCRAYNNWARDYCRADPLRLFAPAVVPQQDLFETLREARRGVEELGLTGIVMRPNPIRKRNLDDPVWEPLWSLLEALDAPLVLHEGTSFHPGVPSMGVDRFDSYLYQHAISHPFEHMIALLSLICGGVLERHPKLRVIQVEAGCGWVPYWLERLDHHTTPWHLRGEAPLKMRPSEYFKRQCLVSADPEENILALVVGALGDDNIAFSTDYPHSDHQFKGMVAKCKARPELSEQTKAKILGANAVRFFRLAQGSKAAAAVAAG